ncbi:uncharacterized protein LOC127478806 isoform X3 [Manacus candei]|uniref:uncharacterized protein LOC127478806 isoform X3 n=1 Tax=Manacus candei TaxID=415023 RepID=UPI002227D148|nr:uncharacterized protein LOC127478806 isoform X3 [Manacus candei]
MAVGPVLSGCLRVCFGIPNPFPVQGYEAKTALTWFFGAALMLFARSVSICSLARGFPWCGGELCFLLGERTALGSCSMSHSCAEPGSLSRLRKAPQERKLYIPPQLYAKGFLPPVSAPFLLLGEHEVDGEDPQASAGTRDSYNCDFPPALVKGTSRILLGMYQLSCWSFSMEYLNTKGENGASRQEEEKPRDSSLSPRQPMNCLAGNGGTGWTLHCSLGMCGTAGTPGAAWADGLDAPAPPFLPSHWGRVQWWHCQPCSGMEPGKCTELSPGIERDQAREVKKEGRREVRQQASSTKLLCKQGITPVSSKALTEVAAAVVPVVWASGAAGEWKRAEPDVNARTCQENQWTR